MSTVSLSSNSLFHGIVTLYILFLVYFPHIFLKLVISHLLISTFILLLSLLRFSLSHQLKPLNNANVILTHSQLELTPRQESKPEPGPLTLVPRQKRAEEGPHSIKLEPEPKPDLHFPCLLDQPKYKYPTKIFTESFIEWDVGAPLEVIHEAYEGEEEGEENDQNKSFDENTYTANTYTFDRYPSLSKFYPDSDSDSDAESGSPAWDGEFPLMEEEKEGLIEIALGIDVNYKEMGFKEKLIEVVHLDEDYDNLIEIDISPTHAFSW